MSDRDKASASTPARFEGELTSGNPFDRAVRIAGFLAEQGVQAVTIVRNDQRQILPARTTDLPGKLTAFATSAAGESRLTLETPIANFEISPTIIRWATTNPTLAQTLHTLA